VRSEFSARLDHSTALCLQPTAEGAESLDMQRWRAVLPVASVGLASVGLWSALTPAPARTQPAPPNADPTTTIATTIATTTSTSLVPATAAAPPPTTTPAPVLLEPSAPPADARAPVAVLPLGRIQIPAIGLDHEIYEGIWLTVIDEGPGHWPGTPLPGGFGNVVLAGHRVTQTHPFRDVDLLEPGDEIRFVMNDGTTATYRMTEQLIVDPDALWIVDQAPGHTLTLFACHPKGSARQRIVIRAELVTA
jgi:sortase A